MTASPKYQNPYFDFILIDDDPHLLEASYALRYQIYCHEQKFLLAENYPEKIETDSFDPYSIHIGAIARRENQLIGTSRMVKPNSHGLPMNEYCMYREDIIRDLGFDNAAALMNDPRTIEISRMAVSANYRRRANDGLYTLSEDDQRRPIQLPDGIERRHTNLPVIFLGMVKMLYQVSKRNGFDYWVAAMDKSLSKHLTKWQIIFQSIGPEIDYYGPVSPYFVEIADIERRMSQNIPDLMEEWLDGLE